MPGYEYRRWGPYFITICTDGRRRLFGRVEAARVDLNPLGRIVRDEWLSLSIGSPWVRIDEYVIMPNHVHGILRIGDDCQVDSPGKDTRPYLGAILGSFKSRTTLRINRLRRRQGAPVWQRGYYEHIIRDVRAMEAIQAYIRANPENWGKDPENPDATR